MTGKLYDARSEESPKYLAGSSSYASDSDICPGLSGSYLRERTHREGSRFSICSGPLSGRQNGRFRAAAYFRRVPALSGSFSAGGAKAAKRCAQEKRSSRRTPPPLGTAAPLRPFDSRKSGTPLSGRFPEHVPLIDFSQHDSVENGLAPTDRKIDTDALPFFRAYVVADRHGRSTP